MKTLLITLATVLLGLVALPNTAEARSCSTGSSHTYHSGRSSCGCSIYTRRVITGYDCYNRPSYRYYSVPVTHSCRSHYSSTYHRGHSNHYSHRSRHSNHRSRHTSHRSHHSSHGKSFTIRGPLGNVTIRR